MPFRTGLKKERKEFFDKMEETLQERRLKEQQEISTEGVDAHDRGTGSLEDIACYCY